jgi:hypothetical protein
MSKILTACLMMAAQTYSIPPAVMVGIYNVEGGKIGQQVYNTNGSYDLGPMQINTIWLPKLADHWGVSQKTAQKWVRDDACTNMGVSAWILRQHLNETGSMSKAIAQYHSRTPHLGQKYKSKVVAAMQQKGLLPPPGADATRISYGSERSGSSAVVVRARQNNTLGKQAVRVQEQGTVGFGSKYHVARTASSETPRYAAQGMNTIVVYNPIDRTSP